MLRKIAVLVFFIQATIALGQSQISFRQLSVREGLSQNSVVSIAQDSTGYLWLATQDGLNKYDGKNFERFDFHFFDVTKPTFSHLGKVYVDRKGIIWIIPISGIPHKYNTYTNTFIPFTEASNVSVIFQDKTLTTWFGTYSNGLFKKENLSIDLEQVLTAEEVKKIFTITEDSHGNIWLGCQNEIISINPETEKVKKASPGGNNAPTNFSSLLFDGSGNLWVGTYGNGIWYKNANNPRYQRPKLKLSGKKALLENLYVTSMFLNNENIWIATYGNGLYKLDSKTLELTNFTQDKFNPRALHYNDILCIFEDYSGTLWFGTDGAGASYYDEHLEKFNSFTNNQTPKGINIDVVRAICQDAKNNLWIGTSGKGLTKYSPKTGKWKTYRKKLNSPGLSSDRIMSLHLDGDHELWIGTQSGGLNIMDTDGNIIRFNSNSKTPLKAATIWDIFEDNRGNIWLGTRTNGLIKFDKEKGVIKQYGKKEGNSLPSNNIRTIVQGKGNLLWIGTEKNGISLFNPQTEKFTNYLGPAKNDNTLASNNIKSLYFSEKDILWVGTNGGGLTAFDVANNNFYTYTTKDGLPNDVIYAILPDANHNLWLSSNKGLTKFTPPASFEERPEITNYNNYDGLATEFNTGAYFKAENGDLYFGGLNGFYWFDPSNIKENVALPKTTITGFEVFDEKFPLENNLVLKSGQNTLSFNFSSMQFSLPEKNQFRYKLKNYEKAWVQAGTRDYVRYTNLPPGDYEFLVKSSNYDGVWNEDPVSFGFTILNPWYLRSPAIIGYLLLLLASLFLIYKYLKWRWKMQYNLKVKQNEAERFKELDEYKTRLYTNLSHEFRTPLTLITAPIKKQLENKELKEEVKNDLHFVEHSTSRLLKLADQLVELSKLESGTVKLRVQKGRLDLLLKSVSESFLLLAQQKNIRFTSTIPEIPAAWFDADAIEKIVNNLLSNAIKYTAPNGKMKFEVKNNQDRELIMEFTNEISEIKEKKTSGLFERFYQLNHKSEGAGIGLALVKELVTLSHGKINSYYPDNTSIKFVIGIPISKNAFLEEEIELEEKLDEEPVLAATLDIYNQQEQEKAIVLIVEDDSEMRRFIGSLLGKEYKVIKAKNGQEGIKKALKIIPDLIISDIMMPFSSGIELCQSLKKDEKTSHIPIILLTAKIGDKNEISGIKSGADDYIAKPFNPKRLLISVQKLIELRKNLRNRYKQDAFLKPKDIAITGADENFLARVQELMDTQLTEPNFTAAKFSELVGMSRMQLHRKLIALTGLSTTAFIRSQRLKIAAKLLKTNNITIAEVAYSTGFSSPSYFTKCFRKVYKSSPLEYTAK